MKRSGFDGAVLIRENEKLSRYSAEQSVWQPDPRSLGHVLSG
jgi:hypothetical protein